MIEDGDADKLKQWLKYCVLLNRVNTNKDKIELPQKLT